MPVTQGGGKSLIRVIAAAQLIPREDEPEVVDEILEEIMKDRAAQALNQRFGQSTT